MKALKLRATVRENGRLRLPPVPFTEGTSVEVIILEREPDDNGLVKAAETSLSFWDNPIDDEVWNDA